MQQRLHRRVAFVEARGHQLGVPIQTQRHLGEVVRADGEAVEILQKLLGQNRVRGHLAHHHHPQPVAAALQAVPGEQLHHLARLVEGAHERDHQLDVGEPHGVAHPAHGAALHLEARAEVLRHVARRPAEPEHRVRLVGFVELAADEVGVLVGLEVRQAHDDRPGVERGRNGRHPLHQLLHEEGLRVRIARDPFAHPIPEWLGETVEFEQRPRVHPDRVADDELQPREPHPGVGERPEGERAVRVADVHRNLEGKGRHGLHIEPAVLEVEPARVDEAGVALRAGDGHLGPLLDGPGRVAGADHGGNAQLAGDDGGVTGPAPAVGHDGGGALHHRLPVGVGHVRDEHVAVAHLVHLRRIEDAPGDAGTDALADAAAFGQHLAMFAQLEAFHRLPGEPALHRLGAGLEDPDAPVHSVPRPLDVHGPAVVAFDGDGGAGELDDLLVVQREPTPVLDGHVLDHDPLVGRISPVHHLLRLAAPLAPEDGRAPRDQIGLVHVELVGVDLTLHHQLPEPPSRGDEHHVLEPRLGVDGEGHAARAEIAPHHALDAGRERDIAVVVPLVRAIGDGAVVVERGEHLAHRIDEGIRAAHVEERLLLPGEGCVGQVLGGGGGTHRHRAVGLVDHHPRVARA